MKTLLAMLLVAFSLNSIAQDGYPMTCVFDGSQSIGVEDHPNNPSKINVYFSFKRATKAANLGVDPGTCAWQDRGLYSDEPSFIQATVNKKYVYMEMIYKGVPQLVLAPVNAPWAPQAKNAGYKITFKVFQSGPADGNSLNFFKVIP